MPFINECRAGMGEKFIMKGGETMKKQYMTAADVAEVVGVSLGKAYDLIRKMNAELEAGGYLTVTGKVPIGFFKKKYYGFEEDG